MEQGELIPQGEEPFAPFRLYGQGVSNYMRRRMGQEQKIVLRSPERKGKIVATVYTGADDAQFFIDAVNYFADHRELWNPEHHPPR